MCMSSKIFEEKLQTLTDVLLSLELDRNIPSMLFEMRREKEIELTTLLGEDTVRITSIVLQQALCWLREADLLKKANT